MRNMACEMPYKDYYRFADGKEWLEIEMETIR
jgi:hypothetical protein